MKAFKITLVDTKGGAKNEVHKFATEAEALAYKAEMNSKGWMAFIERPTYTMADWSQDGTFRAEPGMQVEDGIVSEFRDSVPPEYLSHRALQCGEAYGHDIETGKATYATFTRTNGRWFFEGYRPSMAR